MAIPNRITIFELRLNNATVVTGAVTLFMIAILVVSRNQ
jgi:hypothetical protein